VVVVEVLVPALVQLVTTVPVRMVILGLEVQEEPLLRAEVRELTVQLFLQMDLQLWRWVVVVVALMGLAVMASEDKL